MAKASEVLAILLGVGITAVVIYYFVLPRIVVPSPSPSPTSTPSPSPTSTPSPSPTSTPSPSPTSTPTATVTVNY